MKQMIGHNGLPMLLGGMVLITAASLFFTGGTHTTEPAPKSAVNEEPAAPAAAELPPAFLEFNRFMERELDSSRTVGAAYTVVYDGRIAHTGTFGVRKKGSDEKIDAHTVFRLASVSKGFAGALACLLEQEGKLKLDDRVIDYYPGFSLKDRANTDSLTLAHLLSHTSGLVPYAFDNLVEAGIPLETILTRLPEVDISAPPGRLYGYQNVLFSILDPVSRRATGVPYEVLLREMIFKPLGMEDASAGPVDTLRIPNVAYPHVRGVNGYLALDLHRGYYNVLPAAGINASIADLGQWLLALLGHYPQQLPDTVCRRLSTPEIYTPLKWRYTRYWKPFKERYYSLGWRIYRYRGREIIYHGGYIRGYRAEIGFCPSEGAGIAFVQNSPNRLASQCVPRFFDLLFDQRATDAHFLHADRSGKADKP